MSAQEHFIIEGNIEHFTIADIAGSNPDFRQVLWTGQHAQIVVMTIPTGGEIGEEVHEHTDQILTFVAGTGEADLNGHTHPIEAGDQCAVPAGARHNFRNTGEQPLVLYTVYSPRHQGRGRRGRSRRSGRAPDGLSPSPPGRDHEITERQQRKKRTHVQGVRVHRLRRS